MASGLFAEHRLEVELVGPLGRGPDNVIRTGSGGADFALTSVYYHLAARRQLVRRPSTRFVAVVHQRSPLAAFVPLDSRRQHPSDLGGVRVARSNAAWFEDEYRDRFAELGLEPPVVVAGGEGHRPSLVRGEVDVIFSWDEAVVVIREDAGTPVRSIPFGPDIYSTGLVAADHVPPDVVARVVDAFSAAFEQQRREPRLGIGELCARFPSITPERVSEEWDILEGYVGGDDRCGAMKPDRWLATLNHARRTHGFPPVAVSEVVRTELLEAPTFAAASP